jgi:hypothetical protein
VKVKIRDIKNYIKVRLKLVYILDLKLNCKCLQHPYNTNFSRLKLIN